MGRTAAHHDRVANWGCLAALVGLVSTIAGFVLAFNTDNGAFFGFVFLGVFLLFGGGLASANAEEQKRIALNLPKPPAKVEPPYDEVSVTKWRGILRYTKSPVIVRCQRCKATRVDQDPALANTIARSQGLSNRMIDFGTAAQGIGGSMTPLGGSKTQAAHSHRAARDNELITLYQAMGCRACGSAEVTLQIQR